MRRGHISIIYGGLISKYFISSGNVWSKENLFCVQLENPMPSQDTSTFFLIFSLALVL